MSGIKRFEDLVAWQKSRDMAATIYKTTGEGSFSKDFALRDQIRRAAVSVMSNIAEGFERKGSKEFHQFLVVAKASCAEVRSQLYVALDVGYINKNIFEHLYESSVEVSKIISGLRASVAKQCE
ncbi:four helix bundle protein [Thiohalophilus thiocyanatoxydans]|uniref:Four helix bundle protein n=1 Tax=Thiohalophilus thiocyanatoxydans TaxID=381308 RepID=A0A4R8IXY3_9GAMM|nr:four helix bundle protein [Thiohalophilus thiocyanatoxydans]TDY02669.1 four helix bundle protein [Thiohalophilus thiocyanatoxydans]